MHKYPGTILVGGGLAIAALLTACAGGSTGAGYRVYDPYYSDYHYWGPDEDVYYNRWLDETHRPHRDFRRLPPAQQHQYWTWRHAQRGRPAHLGPVQP